MPVQLEAVNFSATSPRTLSRPDLSVLAVAGHRADAYDACTVMFNERSTLVRGVVMRQLFVVTFACAMCAPPAFAQQSAGDPPTAQTSTAQPPKPAEGRLQAAAEWIQDIFGGDKPKNGFYPEFGGLPPGSGVSAGPGYRQPLFGGRAVVDGSAAVAWSRGTFARASIELPRLLGDRVTVGAQVKRQDFTRLGFFGIGPASLESDGTDYRLENTDYLAFATVKPRTWLTVGGQIGYSQPVSIERPRAADSPPTQDLFTPSTAPGLSDRAAFLHSDAYVTVDTRNHPSRPTSGGNYRVSFSTFNDRDFGRYSFRRVEGEASRFIPILHENWVIALRARVAASDTAAGNVVPFYMLPTLGGSRSLRGYEDYRFRDRNLLLLNAEYRWRVFGAMDGAIFYDAGKVAPRFGDLDFTHLKSSYGLGFRFHSNETTFLRVDVGRSREGTRVLLSITDALRPGHGSIFIPYVP